MKGWHRANKQELALRIALFLGHGLKESEVGAFVGKSRVRVYQIVKLFSLRDPIKRGEIISGSLPPEKT